MRTLSTELGAWIDRIGPAPRVYADANVPAGLVRYMRQALGWDVFFVLEHADLRRARDVQHFHLAHQMHRTLVTLDRDYFDDRRFPPERTSGVLVIAGPDERSLGRVLKHVDRLFREAPGSGHDPAAPRTLPLAGRKLYADPEWANGRPPRR
jgi:hypothetical protein